MGDPPAGRSRQLSLHFAVINLIHCRRVRRRNLSAKGRLPDDYLLFDDSSGKHLSR
ncbi:MAG: hypothetical protein LBK82_03845 [Planctomycetaceae bacterium]|nr:hypothetical protein [Planctomycetaceae bacterium]